jgi:hypothetical protein
MAATQVFFSQLARNWKILTAAGGVVVTIAWGLSPRTPALRTQLPDGKTTWEMKANGEQTGSGNTRFGSGSTPAFFADTTNGRVGVRTASPKTALEVVGTASASALTVSGLNATACDVKSTNGVFSCGTDATGGGGASSNTGAILDAGNSRFVNVSGDTMTGTLLVKAAISGASLRIDSLKGCDTIDTSLAGVLSCGTDDTGTDSADDLSDNDTDDLTEGSTNQYFTTERVDDRVDALVVDGTNISTSYNDGSNSLTINATDTNTTYFPAEGLQLVGTFFSRIAAMTGTSLEVFGTASGRVVHAQDLLRSSGALLVEGATVLQGSLKILTLNCTGNANDGALTADANGAITCSDDDSGAGGLTQTAADARFINAAGDTATGAIAIRSGNGTVSIDANVLLEVAGTASGDVLHAQRLLRSSGALAVEGATVLQSALGVTGLATLTDDLVVNGGNVNFGASTTIGDGGDQITLDSNGTLVVNDGTINLSNQTVAVTLNNAANALNFDSNTFTVDASNNRVGVGTSAPGATFEAEGLMSGSTLAVAGNKVRVTQSGLLEVRPTTTSTGGILLTTAPLGSSGQADSPHITLEGKSNNGSAHVSKGKIVWNVTGDNGDGEWNFTHAVDSPTYTTDFVVTSSSDTSFKGVLGVENTKPLRFNGLGDANWQIGRETNLTSKAMVTGNDIEIIANDDVNGGFAIGKNAGNSYMEIRGSDQQVYFRGEVGVGTINADANLQVTGGGICAGSDANCNTDNDTEGVIYSSSTAMTLYDLAERYPTKDKALTGTTILALDPNNPVFVKKAERGDKRLIGVLSLAPAIDLGGFNGAQYKAEKNVAVALKGRVPVDVSTENGTVAVGDPLTVSSVPGVAMKAGPGDQIVGYALEPFAGRRAGRVLVFIELDELPGTPGAPAESPLAGCAIALSAAAVLLSCRRGRMAA